LTSAGYKRLRFGLCSPVFRRNFPDLQAQLRVLRVYVWE